MPNFERDTGECTADVGVMGNRGCHRWPGCGCGGSNYEEDREQTSNKSRTPPTYYRPPSKWVGFWFDSARRVPVGGGLEIQINRKTLLLKKEIRFKIIGSEVLFLRKDIEGFKTIEDMFQVVGKS